MTAWVKNVKPVNYNVLAAISKKKYGYQDAGLQLNAVCVGPREYLSIYRDVNKGQEPKDVNAVFKLPLFIKHSPGIDFIFDTDLSVACQLGTGTVIEVDDGLNDE